MTDAQAEPIDLSWQVSCYAELGAPLLILRKNERGNGSEMSKEPSTRGQSHSFPMPRVSNRY